MSGDRVRIANFIDGKMRPPGMGRYLEVYEPATGQVYAEAPDSTDADLELAVEAELHAAEGQRSEGVVTVRDLALRRDGPSIWRRFKRGPAETLWYYRRVADLVRQRLGPHPLAEELEVAIAALERVPGHTAGVVGTLSPRAGQ